MLLLQNIIKDKTEIMIQWETGTDSERKYFRQRGVKYTEIDNKV